MKYQLTKEEVFEAILTEPVLQGGKFYKREWNKKDGTRGKHCAACALGAVALRMRRSDAGYLGWLEFSSMTNSLFSEDDLHEAYKIGNFASILSCEFETAWSDIEFNRNEDLARFHALMIVEAMCPDVLEFKI